VVVLGCVWGRGGEVWTVGESVEIAEVVAVGGGLVVLAAGTTPGTDDIDEVDRESFVCVDVEF